MSQMADSQFYMWRTLFALVHVDGIVTQEEAHFMEEALKDMPFSDEQRSLLQDDIRHANNPVEMFEQISDPLDQARFFQFAHKVVWVDGNFAPEEKGVMLALKEIHTKNVDVNELVGKVELELEDEPPPAQPIEAELKEHSMKKIMSAFKGLFT